MNKLSPAYVLFFMRVFVFLAMASFTLVSCGGSRSVDEQLVIGPGHHQLGSIMGSDVFVPKGSTLDVAFSSGNRFYVSSGASLSGFKSGSRETRIYAEPGAKLPAKPWQSGMTLKSVSNASAEYRDRFRALPALRGRAVLREESSADFNEDDSERYDDKKDRSHRRRKALSAQAESYQRKE